MNVLIIMIIVFVVLVNVTFQNWFEIIQQSSTMKQGSTPWG